MRHQAEHLQHVGFLDRAAAERNQLVQGTLRIAQPALGAAGDGGQRGRFDLYLLALGHLLQPFHDQVGGDPPQIEALAS